MRILFLALMIALLPLRGWVGDAMAVELAAQALAAVHTPVSAAELVDCHQGHAHAAPQVAQHAAAPAAAQADEHASADCDTCTSCQICHTVALTAVLPRNLAPVPADAAPQSSRPRYASAERVLGDKPPIS